MDPVDPDESSGIFLFSNDILKIPCFRDSFLIGLSSFVGVSIPCFIMTSRPGRSMNYGFGVFMLTTFPYWFYCSNAHFKTLEDMERARHAIKERTQDDYNVMDSLVHGAPPPPGS